VDEARDKPLKQLPLTEDDHGLVLDPLRNVAEAIDRLAEPDEVDEQLCPPCEQRAADGEERGERDSAERDVYGSALPRSAARTAPRRSAAMIALRRAAAMIALRRAAAMIALRRSAITIAPSSAPP
jgi:hypothetical protein